MTWIHVIAATLLIGSTVALLAFLRLAENAATLARAAESSWPQAAPELPLAPPPALALVARERERGPELPYRHAA